MNRLLQPDNRAGFCSFPVRLSLDDGVWSESKSWTIGASHHSLADIAVNECVHVVHGVLAHWHCQLAANRSGETETRIRNEFPFHIGFKKRVRPHKLGSGAIDEGNRHDSGSL